MINKTFCQLQIANSHSIAINKLFAADSACHILIETLFLTEKKVVIVTYTLLLLFKCFSLSDELNDR